MDGYKYNEWKPKWNREDIEYESNESVNDNNEHFKWKLRWSSNEVIKTDTEAVDVPSPMYIEW